jgi:hypothetical protein
MSQNITVQEGSDTVWIELGDITLNIYHITEEYMTNIRNQIDSVTKLDKILKKIKCSDLQEVRVVLEMESDWFYDSEWACCGIIKKCIPIPVIKERAKVYLASTDHKVEQSRESENERAIMNLFTSLNQKHFIEKIIIEISNLKQEDFMEFYVKNCGRISFDDFLDLYYTFKIKK